MAYIPLVEHTRPRVMMIDFSPADVQKVCNAGFEAKRSASGAIESDRNQFILPFAVQDVEVVFAHVTQGAFDRLLPGGGSPPQLKKAAEGSVEPQMSFDSLCREVWKKTGWIVCFVSPRSEPWSYAHLGIEGIGVHKRSGYFENIKNVRDVHAHFPLYTGQAIHIEEKSEVTPLLKRFLKTAQLTVLACATKKVSDNEENVRYQSELSVANEGWPTCFLMWDTSEVPKAMALEVAAGFEGELSRVLLLPDFGSNNVNVALALLQEVIPSLSPHLFDSPSHPWLEKYQPASVLQLQAQKQQVLEAAQQHAEALEAQAQAERERYVWLSGLLVSSGDEFADHAAQALRFLGFEVEDVDQGLDPAQRRREDFRIRDDLSGFFALGEAKTTGKGRGASEEFISKTQNHQARFSREEKVPVPGAFLIANFAIDLDPALRAGRFYQPEVAGRLEENGITAINSVALFQLCQWVVEGRLSREAVRRFLMQGQPMINTVVEEEFDEIGT